MVNDLISRQAVIEALQNHYEVRNPFVGKNTTINDCVDIIQELPPAQQWTPFTTRPCTEQEKAEHPDWGFYLDCQLPDDGGEILITTRDGYVCKDEIFCEGDCWYLDSGYVLGEEAVAWMPLPEPYTEEVQE